MKSLDSSSNDKNWLTKGAFSEKRQMIPLTSADVSPSACPALKAATADSNGETREEAIFWWLMTSWSREANASAGFSLGALGVLTKGLTTLPLLTFFDAGVLESSDLLEPGNSCSLDEIRTGVAAATPSRTSTLSEAEKRSSGCDKPEAATTAGLRRPWEH